MTSEGGQGGAGPRRVGLVVIHGVGEAEPGECLNPLLIRLTEADQRYKFDARNQFSRLVEIEDDPEAKPETEQAVRTWPVVEQSGEHASGIAINAVELFWADTTRLGAGRLDTVLGLFRVIFESQHLFYAMLARHRERASGFVLWILLIAAWFLRGPIAALTIVTSAFCILYLFEPDYLRLGLPSNSPVRAYVPDVLSNGLSVEAQFVALLMVIFGSSLWAFNRIRKTKDLSWYDLVFWLGAVSMILAVLILSGMLADVLSYVPPLKGLLHQLFGVGPDGSGSDCRQAGSPQYLYVCGLYKTIIWGWRIWGALLLACTGVLTFFWMQQRKTSNRKLFDRMSTSVAILMLQFMLWTTIVVSFLYFMLTRAEGNAAISELVHVPDVAKVKAMFAERGDKQDIVDLFSLANIEPDWISRFKFVYVATTFALVGLIAGGIALLRRRRRRAMAGLANLQGEALEDRLKLNHQRMPRFLFNSALVKFLICTFIGVMALVLFQTEIETNALFIAFRGIFLPIAAAIALIVPMFFGPVITNVVHIARDLIDHHFRPSIETGSRFLPKFFRFKSRQPRRDRINNRLIRLIEERVRPWNCDDIIFVAHSQGSVIAYDYLLNREARHARLGDTRLAFLSFGSPIGTIYQTYFDEYVHRAPVPISLATRLWRWINIFRIDDYIGGRIESPPGLAVSNRIMPPGEHMHTNYWGEDYLALALDELIQGRRPELKSGDPTSWPRVMPALVPKASHAIPES